MPKNKGPKSLRSFFCIRVNNQIYQQQPFAAAMPVDVSEVVKDWMDVEIIKSRAAVYKLMSYELGINPEAAESHSIVLAPLMQHLGLLDANIRMCFHTYVTSMFMKQLFIKVLRGLTLPTNPGFQGLKPSVGVCRAAVSRLYHCCQMVGCKGPTGNLSFMHFMLIDLHVLIHACVKI